MAMSPIPRASDATSTTTPPPAHHRHYDSSHAHYHQNPVLAGPQLDADPVREQHLTLASAGPAGAVVSVVSHDPVANTNTTTTHDTRKWSPMDSTFVPQAASPYDSARHRSNYPFIAAYSISRTGHDSDLSRDKENERIVSAPNQTKITTTTITNTNNTNIVDGARVAISPINETPLGTSNKRKLDSQPHESTSARRIRRKIFELVNSTKLPSPLKDNLEDLVTSSGKIAPDDAVVALASTPTPAAVPNTAVTRVLERMAGLESDTQARIQALESKILALQQENTMIKTEYEAKVDALTHHSSQVFMAYQVKVEALTRENKRLNCHGLNLEQDLVEQAHLLSCVQAEVKEVHNMQRFHELEQSIKMAQL